MNWFVPACFGIEDDVWDFVKGSVPFKPAVFLMHVFARLERHSGVEKQDLCYRRNWPFFKGLTLAMLW